MTDSAQVLLDRAEVLLVSPQGATGATGGNSARLAAVLTRQAVEELIDARCADLCEVPAVAGSARARVAVLKSLDTTTYGTVLIDAWHQLTIFCHHHAYTLSPTVAEVRAQCEAVRTCVEEEPAG